MGNISGIPLGGLAARIGPSGQIIRVGSSYTGKATAAGTLRLVMMISMNGQPTNGQYQVTVTVGDD